MVRRSHELPEITKLRLYRIFHLADEDYITTVMLVDIYRWIEPSAGDLTFDAIEDLRKYFLDIENKKTLYNMHKKMKLISMIASGNYDTTTRSLPMRREKYVRGWRL